MDHFHYSDRVYHAESVALPDIASAVGTPCYVYSRATIEHHWQVFDRAFGDYPHQICYAVKANSNLAVLKLLVDLGSGFDIVSGGELARVLAAGGDAARVVFSGVAKTSEEIAQALSAGIQCFDVESLAELERINQVAGELNRVAPIAIRVNPDVDAATHPKIATGLRAAKFGIDFAEAETAYQRAAALPNIAVHGIAAHIGSQITALSPFIDALGRLLELVQKLTSTGINIQHLDIGGGLGISYQNEQPPAPDDYASALVTVMREFGETIPITIEPGRAIVGNAGILLTRTEYLKRHGGKNFAIVDAGMNDLIRPAMYDAWQEIVAVVKSDTAPQVYDVVGPVCETGDVLGYDRELVVVEGDLLAVRSAGAYGASMASNYNSRRRPAEVLVEGDQFRVIRQRESYEQMMIDEQPG